MARRAIVYDPISYQPGATPIAHASWAFTQCRVMSITPRGRLVQSGYRASIHLGMTFIVPQARIIPKLSGCAPSDTSTSRNAFGSWRCVSSAHLLSPTPLISSEPGLLLWQNWKKSQKYRESPDLPCGKALLNRGRCRSRGTGMVGLAHLAGSEPPPGIEENSRGRYVALQADPTVVTEFVPRNPDNSSATDDSGSRSSSRYGRHVRKRQIVLIHPIAAGIGAI